MKSKKYGNRYQSNQNWQNWNCEHQIPWF